MTASSHRLQPLLAPRSIAVIGASPRPDTAGNDVMRQLKHAGYPGGLYPINPKYETIEATRCFPNLGAVPERVEHAVLVVANDRVEQQFRDAIAHGAKAVTIFGSCYLEADREPALTRRIAAMAREAGIEMCGANCIGWINTQARAAANWFPVTRFDPGSIAFITHSGAVYCAMVELDFRLKFNIAVSAGQELATTVAAYMDYALELPSTRVIALFLETIREPAAFIAALEKARARDIPVVAVKVGRTPLSATLAESHSGAIAGDDAAYQALFDRYGVIRVASTDELAATALLLSSSKRAAAGGLAAILDSGGGRGLLIDLAKDFDLAFAEISERTRQKLAARLEYGLAPVNPLDAWGSGKDFAGVYRDCLTALMDDPDTAAGVFFYDMPLEDYISRGFTRILKEVAAGTGKPLIAATNMARMPRTKLAAELSDAGIPVLDGMDTALRAMRGAFAHRDLKARPALNPPAGPGERVRDRWLERLASPPLLGPEESLALLADYALPVLASAFVTTPDEAIEAAARLGLPVALKTAMAVDHKSDVGGVKLNLGDAASVGAAYDDLAARLGPRVQVSPMAAPGVEIAMGIVVDAQFGPLVMIGAGGVLVELLRDVRFALAPLDAAEARRLINSLGVRRMLDGVRGQPRVDKDALALAFARLSVLAGDLAPVLKEVDVNPYIATPAGGAIVDALIKPR